jgi:REP element-mobilizing transposase RayT
MPLHGHDQNQGNDLGGDRPSVSDVVGWFKSWTTNQYIRGVKAGVYPVFDKRLWQRNYYEHIIRTETAYNQIAEYIRTNPERWAEDRLR